MNVALILLDGRHQGRRIKLPPTQFVIGRDPKCHLRPASRRVSRFHCAVARRGADLVVRDLHSQNGTFINGRPLEGAARLQHGDVLQVGGLRFEVEIDEAAARSSRPDSGLLWLLDEQQTGAPGAAVPTSETSYALEAFDAGLDSAETTVPAPPGSSDTLVAGDYLQDYAERRTGKD